MNPAPTGDLEIYTFPVPPLGCNCAVLIHKPSAEAVVLDPGGDAPKIISLLQEKGCTVKWILHTHAHFDHCLGTEEVAAAYSQSGRGPQVGLHADDTFLFDRIDQQCRWFGLEGKAPRDVINHRIRDEERIEFGTHTMNVIHTPGHTPGSCCFSLPDHGLVFSGDTLFAGGIGRTDLPGGDSELIIKSIKGRLFALDDGTIVVPGHGDHTRIYEEKTTNPFF